MYWQYFKDKKSVAKISILLLGIILVTSFAPIQEVLAVLGLNLGPEKNLSNSPLLSRTSQMASLDDDVYLMWHEGSNIFFISSNDKGVNFNTPEDIGDTSLFGESFPQLSVSSDTIYAVWLDGVDGEIKLKPITNGGKDFSSAIISLSSSTSTSSNKDAKVSSQNDNVYTVWRDQEGAQDNRILFRASNDKGNNFNSIIALEDDTDSSDPKPEVASFGNNVFVVWSSSTAIPFVGNNNLGNGADWNAPVFLGSGPSLSDPQIDSSTGNIYVIWQEGTDVKFATSTVGGASFVTEDIGDSGAEASEKATPQLSVSGTNVYVVWRDQNDGAGDIKFRSRDGSGTWNPPLADPATNLSDNTGNSKMPKVISSGNNVYVAWQDLTNDHMGDILIRASGNNGASFGGVQNLGGSSDGTTSLDSTLAVSGDSVYAAWTDLKPGNFEILFRTGAPSIDVSFDKSQYKLSDTAILTITDESRIGEGSIVLDSLTSSSDPSGIVGFTLNENPPNSGTFTGSFTFGDQTSDTTLKAVAGDSITATFDGQSSTVTIFPIDIKFILQGFGEVASYDYGDFASIVVEDPNAAGSGQITINLRSTLTDSVVGDIGRTLVLKENPPNSGTFGSSSELVFPIGLGNDQWPPFGQVTVDQTFPLSTPGFDPDKIDTIDVLATSTSDPAGITITLTETDIDSKKFINEDLIITPFQSDEVRELLHAEAGDFVSVTSSIISSHAFIPGGDNPSRGAVAVGYPVLADPDNVKDTVTVEYRGTSESIDVRETTAGGGGGGGLVRPGLVVNVLAGSVLFGGGGDGPSEPTFGEATFLVMENASDEGFGGTISEPATLDSTQTFEVGEEVSLRFNLFENQGINNIEIVKLYFNFGGENYDKSSIDTYLTYDRGTVILVDPNNKFATADIEILQEDAWNLVVKTTLNFANTMDTSNILIESIDLDRNYGKQLFVDAIQVVEPSITLADSKNGFAIQPQDNSNIKIISDEQADHIPIWVKSNALWWKQQQIDDSDFAAGIKYLINQAIIDIPQQNSGSVSIHEVPQWLRDVAGFWADDSISDEEFVQAMQWLIENKVINIQE